MDLKWLYDKHSSVVTAVRKDHREHTGMVGCHDLLHTMMVANYCYIISGVDERFAERCWIAGLLHNTDRLFGDDLTERKVSDYLGLTSKFDDFELLSIIEAVLQHSEKNKATDQPVTIVLKDADRLANIGPLVILRAGQFITNVPAVDPRYIDSPDPTARYNNPKSLVQNLRYALEWEEGWLRTPKARELAKKYFDGLRTLIQGCHDQLDETSLLPFPFPEDYEALWSR